MSDTVPSSPNPAAHNRLARFRNWLSLAGLVLAVSAFFAFVLLFAVDLFSVHANPYMGILAYVVAPMFLFLGLGMALAGYVLETRRIRKGLPERKEGFVLKVDLSRQRDRRMLGVFVAGSFAFIFLTALGSYQSYHLTETNSFCGEACHVPMEPQYRAYEHSAHAKVACVACHVGPGAGNYIRTKVSGVRQLWHTIRGDFNRPIRLHNVNQRPAEETCQSCHWSQKHTGDLQKTYKRFMADEDNTPFTIQMIMKVGGSNPVHGPVEGIHSHMNVDNRIEFISLDDSREEIPWVRVTDSKGKVTEYRREGFTEDISKYPIRRMDCMDCHNRPSHRFLSPNVAVDRSLAFGRIDPAIPWAKANVVKALVQPYATREEANRKIAESLRADYPDDPRVESVIAEAIEIYKHNFFPEMKADWRVHPDHIGHKDTPGCFRCHDGKHFASDGKTSIKGSDCNACHLIVAQGSGAELEKVTPTGVDFFHLDSPYLEPDCSSCHNGQLQE
jgi:nitrate/TMAO reductase-like tetraheme cytochrome c subunit